ncbi:MAG: ATP-binding cassette domain-containing protein [Bacteroidales bacterium]|jgi:ABC-type lipoprotein export system ATPase subunit|nr:ATP-binding cassette domain-containing protein [Bacteroidales bacterium]
MFAEICRKEIQDIVTGHPEIIGFFSNYGIILPENHKVALDKYLYSLPDEMMQDIGIGHEQLLVHLEYFLEKQKMMMDADQRTVVESITIIGGQDKSGEKEDVTLTLRAGSVTGVVGATGSGKSRLLADIEWMAQGDTPTGRQIRINGAIPDVQRRFSPEHKLVAQLSQNMNFVMDATVGEFIRMHAESRFIRDANRMTADVILQANTLAGEPFADDAPLTSLSGGQSRALMIADTAFLSTSPVVLIDEIENAGIDRKKALHLLVKKEKIVLIATHDPILALMVDQRLVIKNGGICRVIRTSDAEKKLLSRLEKLDNRMQTLRRQLRNGDAIQMDGYNGRWY